jgi:hypothetical protein
MFGHLCENVPSKRSIAPRRHPWMPIGEEDHHIRLGVLVSQLQSP